MWMEILKIHDSHVIFGVYIDLLTWAMEASGTLYHDEDRCKLVINIIFSWDKSLPLWLGKVNTFKGDSFWLKFIILNMLWQLVID